jgi:SAM-dependent methyltransferase
MAAAAQLNIPQIGSDAHFAALRTALDSAGYTESAVCQRLGIQKIYEFRLLGDPHLTEDPPDTLGKLIRLLMECGPVSRADSGALPWAELDALDLVMPDPSESGQWVCRAMVYPVAGLYIASDRTRPLQDYKTPEDIVYPGIVKNTALFLSLVPFTPCDAFLDLCSGTGVAALAAARGGARHAYAYDLTERSTHYAEFNRRLNAIENMTAGQGDLYDPAGDLTFDRIAVHPPYVPVFRKHAIFDSGGQDGEQIVRRIIEGLPRYLRPGGRFYALTMGTDRQKPFEQRVRDFLGESESEFDVAFVVGTDVTPKEYVAQAVVQYQGVVSDIPAWEKLFEEWGVRRLPYGLLTVQRRAERRPVFTARRQMGPNTGPAEHHWLMDWETSVVRSGATDLLALQLRAREGARLRVEHKLEGQAWKPVSFHFDIQHPFSADLNAQAWTGHLLQRADGTLRGAALLEAMKSDGAVDPATPPHEFAQILALLVSGGFLEVV